MKTFFTKLREVAIAGFFFLLPVYVLFIIITKVWTSLSSVGATVAGMFGMKSILGVNSHTVFSGLLLITIWVACGLLVRFAFIVRLNKSIENLLSKYIPGYEAYRTVAEDKLYSKAKMLPYASALVKQQECWQPAFIVEQDADGNYVVFFPDTPDTNKGRLCMANKNQVRMMPWVTADQLDSILKHRGRGLLNESTSRDEEVS